MWYRTRTNLVGIALLVGLLGGCEPPPKSPSTAPASAPAMATGSWLEGFTESGSATFAADPSPDSPPAIQSSDGVPTFQPLKSATIGQWAQYAALQDRAIRYSIAAANETHVTVETRVYDDSLLVGLPSSRREPRSLDPLQRQFGHHPGTRSCEPARIQAAGRTFEGLLYQDTWTDEGVQYLRQTWVSPDVPIYGIIKMELLGDGQLEARMELADYRGG